MRMNFCTLFNSAYLSRGLSLYQSLLRHCPDFHLYVFAFDNDTLNYFNKEQLPSLTVISLKDFEDAELLEVKKGRTNTEYCWTCTASSILYAIRKYSLEMCTYIDADMLFYSDPSLLFDEMKDASVLITLHNYSPEYDQSLISGKYCVQFVAFRNDERGMKVLQDWRDDTLNWCYARVEDGKFGDQKYLDSWQDKYEGVHVLEHKGGGIAPWNVQQFQLKIEDGKYVVTEMKNGIDYRLVFFHFHGLKFFENDIVLLTGVLYEIKDEVRDELFIPYLKSLLIEGQKVQSSMPGLNVHGINGTSPKKPLTPLLSIAYYFSDLRYSVKNITGRELRRRFLHHHYYYISSLISD